MRLLWLTVLLGSAVAAADPKPDAFVDTLPATAGTSPKVRATLVGESTLDAAACTISVAGVKVAGASVAPYDPDEPIAIVIVFNDQELWTSYGSGDDDEYDPDRASRLPLSGLEKAIDDHDFTKLGPASSEVAIVGYATGTEIVQPFAPLAKLKSTAFEPRSRYHGRAGTDLVQGITAGISLLETAKATRRALIVFGDGADTNNATAGSALAELAIRARRARIELFGIRYLSYLSSDAEVLSQLIRGLTPRSSHDGIATDLARIMSRLTDRETIVFPGGDLTWDGHAHPVALDCPNVHVDTSVELPLWATEPGKRPLYLWILIGGVTLLAVGLIALGVVARR